MTAEVVMICVYVFCFFFFSSRRRHTRFKCNWSSDVCSSDLYRGVDQGEPRYRGNDHGEPLARLFVERAVEIGRASCRERVSISVVAVSLKKKKKHEEKQASVVTSKTCDRGT